MDFSLLKNHLYYIILLQLALISYFISFFNIGEAFNLKTLFMVFFVGFIINSLVTVKYKKIIYLLVFFVGLFWIMTWKDVAVFSIVFTLILISINIPVKLIYRKGILIIIALSIAVLKHFDRYELLSSNIITLLACIYMFRAIIFIFELKYSRNKINFLDQLNYFLSPSNLIYPIFPVLDFKTFTNSFYNTNALHIYQKGIITITRGLLHIYAYRIIESIQYFDFFYEKDSFGLLINILFAFSFVIRLSGILHFSVGIIQLFGYNLPDIFNNYFLSKGFADFWRRINIYWRDFIVKIIFNPLYFKLKKRRVKYIISITTIISFIVTILFHAYQFFWLTGDIIFKDTDLLFWLGLGIVIVVETNLKKKETKFSFVNYIIDGLKISFTLITIAILWYFWNFETIKNGFSTIVNYNLNYNLNYTFFTTLILVLVLTLSNFLFEEFDLTKIFFFKPSVFNTSLIVGILLFFNYYEINPNNKKKGLFTDHLINGIDEKKAFIGYYENTINTSFASLSKKPKKKWRTNFFIDTTNCSSIPNNKTYVRNRIKYDLNKLGFREDITSLKPKEGYIRINIYGGSNEYGSGIKKKVKTFKDILKKSIAYRKVEMLNLSLPSKGFLINVNDFLIKGKEFNPNISIFFYHASREKEIGEYFLDKFKNCSGSVDLNKLRTINKCEVGIKCKLINELESYEYYILKLAEKCKEIKSLPVIVFMPPNSKYAINNIIRKEISDEVKRIADKNGVYVIDIFNVFNQKTYNISKTDSHYDEKGHQIIADSLTPKFKQLLNHYNKSLKVLDQ